MTIPKGALYVPSTQPLGRLAFVLFQPESDDGLGAWDLIGTEDPPDGSGKQRFGALRLVGWTVR